jgi:flavorubredoxin
LNIKRFWPEKKWKKIVLISFIVILIFGISLLGFVSIAINSDVVSEIVVVNNQGYSNALLVYHPGFTSFTKDVSYAFAEGLSLNDWRIEITTPSNQAPTSISDYNLLVVVAPVYGFDITPTISRYIDGMNDLQEIRTAIIITAAGSPGSAAELLKESIEQKNGIIDSQTVLFSLAPNEGDQSVTYLSKEAGSKIFP